LCAGVERWAAAELLQCDRSPQYGGELLSKMAPLIGQEMTERLFLQRFALLCADPLFHVRKVCAANFGDFSGVVGSQPTEQTLLSKFFSLCEDGVWGVRKACADVFMPVSCVCSPAVRQAELSPLFINLLRDQSRWVRMAAFQALGPFISTFADPLITALLHNENGEIVITDTDLLAERLARLVTLTEQKQKTQNIVKDGDNGVDVVTVNPSDTENHAVEAENSSVDINEKVDSSEKSSETEFSSFQYWREPMCSLVLDDLKQLEDDNQVETEASLKLDKLHEATIEEVKNELSSLDSESSSDHFVASLKSDCVGGAQTDAPTLSENANVEDVESILEAHISETIDSIGSREPQDSSASETSEDEKQTYADAVKASKASELKVGRWEGDASSLHSSRSSLDSFSAGQLAEREAELQDLALPRGPPQTEQSIVPQLLIDHYVSMIDPSRAQTVDNDIARHCAFSLPAVALTLGRANWPLIRETYETLANDMQWKVRRTVASSIHELGVILGEDIATEDLVPIFDGFIKDLDEVRIGALKHLADFLALLSENTRNAYLPRLEEFLKMDNERNWRFRLELTEQIGAMRNLFSACDVREHLAPIALQLVQDKVAAVRAAATAVLSQMLLQLFSLGHPILASSLASNMVNLGKSGHWARRQTFALLCGEVVQLDSEAGFSSTSFSTDLLPHLLDLTWDKVPNVRLAVAKVVVQLNSKYFVSCGDLVEAAIVQLKQDKDSNVREAAGGQTDTLLQHQQIGTTLPESLT